MQLAWNESLQQVTERRLQQILDERRAVTYPGVKLHHIASLSVLHEELDGFHVHEADLQLHLLSDHRLTTCYAPADFRRFKLWQETVNQRFDYTSPDDCRAEISASESPRTRSEEIVLAIRKSFEQERQSFPAATPAQLVELLLRQDLLLPASDMGPELKGRFKTKKRGPEWICGEFEGNIITLRGTLIVKANRLHFPAFKDTGRPRTLAQNIAELAELVQRRFEYLKMRLPAHHLLERPWTPWQNYLAPQIAPAAPPMPEPARPLLSPRAQPSNASRKSPSFDL